MAGAKEDEPEFYAMAENNNVETTRVYVDAQSAAMGERVSNLNRRQTDLENEMRIGFRAVETQITSLTNETRTALQSISTTMAERNKPQWQALSVMLAFVTILGALAYWPIREKAIDLQSDQNALASTTSVAIQRIAETAVTRQELDWREARGSEDRLRNEQGIRDLRDTTVTRNEWTERNRARDSEVADHQRQIDQLRQELLALSSSLGNGGDNIRELKEDQDRLRDRLAELLYRRGVTGVSP